MAEVKDEIRAVAVLVTDERATKETVASAVASMPPEDVPTIVVRARYVATLVKAVIDAGEGRLRAEKLLTPGAQWVDRGTGVIYEFVGEKGDWKVADPKGLRLALAALVRKDGSRLVEDAEIDAAVAVTYKANHTKLNDLAKRDQRVREIVDDFRTRDAGPEHLKEATV